MNTWIGDPASHLQKCRGPWAKSVLRSTPCLQTNVSSRPPQGVSRKGGPVTECHKVRCRFATLCDTFWPCSERHDAVTIGRPQMWERVQVGFGSTGKKRKASGKGPCTKQCVWRKHASQTLKHCKIQSRKDAPKMAILEAPCAQNAPGRSTMRPPEALLPRNPTWESPHFSGPTTQKVTNCHRIFVKCAALAYSNSDFVTFCSKTPSRRIPFWDRSSTFPLTTLRHHDCFRQDMQTQSSTSPLLRVHALPFAMDSTADLLRHPVRTQALTRKRNRTPQ